MFAQKQLHSNEIDIIEMKLIAHNYLKKNVHYAWFIWLTLQRDGK